MGAVDRTRLIPAMPRLRGMSRRLPMQVEARVVLEEPPESPVAVAAVAVGAAVAAVAAASAVAVQEASGAVGWGARGVGARVPEE